MTRLNRTSTGAEWTVGGATFKTGKAGQRCLDDIAREFGDEAAEATAVRVAAIVDEVAPRFSGARQPRLSRADVAATVEVFLAAGGLDDGAIRALATLYRSGRDASAELARRG